MVQRGWWLRSSLRRARPRSFLFRAPAAAPARRTARARTRQRCSLWSGLNDNESNHLKTLRGLSSAVWTAMIPRLPVVKIFSIFVECQYVGGLAELMDFPCAHKVIPSEAWELVFYMNMETTIPPYATICSERSAEISSPV